MNGSVLGIDHSWLRWLFPGTARKLRAEYPGAIYHPPALEATAGQVC